MYIMTVLETSYLSLKVNMSRLRCVIPEIIMLIVSDFI